MQELVKSKRLIESRKERKKKLNGKNHWKVTRMEENKPKRKTHTSSAVKNRYNAKNYKNFRAAIKPDLYERIDEYLKQEGISRPEFLLRAIEKMKGEQQ